MLEEGWGKGKYIYLQKERESWCAARVRYKTGKSNAVDACFAAPFADDPVYYYPNAAAVMAPNVS